MTSLQTLYKSASHYLAGNAGVMVLGFISFPLFTRSVSVAQYGELNIALRIVLLLVILAKIGLPHSMLRFYAEDANSLDRTIVERFYSTFLITGMAAALLVTSIFVLVVTSMSEAQLSGSLRFLLLVGAFMILANALNSLLTGVLRSAGRSKEFAGVQLVVKLASIAISCALLFLWERSARALMTSNVSSEVATCAILFVLFNRARVISLRRFDYAYARKIVAFALPLVVFELAAAVLDSGDRILIRLFLGAEAVGLYSAAYNVSSYLQDLIFASLNLALIPIYLSIWNAKGKDETVQFLSSSFNDFLLVCCLLVCVTTVAAGDALVLLASSKYRDAAPLVPLLVVGLVIYTLTTFFNAGLYLHKRTGTMAMIVGASAAVNIVLNVVFLPRMGILAAVWSTIASFAVLLIATALFSARYMRLHIDFAGAVAGVVAAAVTAALVSRVDAGRPFFNIVAKGSLSALGYCILLLALNTRVRTRVRTSLRAA